MPSYRLQAGIQEERWAGETPGSRIRPVMTAKRSRFSR